MQKIDKQQNVTVQNILRCLNELNDENMVYVGSQPPTETKKGLIWINPEELSQEPEVRYVGHMVGDIYPISYTELEEGQIILSGQLVSRQVYQVLWNWVEKHPSLLKTEQEWNEYFNNTNGLCCPYFSYGTNDTNFRLPNYSGVFIRADSDITKINQFSEDTQRNILGQFATFRTSWDDGTGELLFNANGALKKIESGNNMDSIHQDSSDRQQQIVDFDASRSVGAEHTGEEVKPKSITKLPIVYAFGRIVNAGELDFQTVVQKQNDLTLNHQIKSFTDLTQIGLTNGIEQFQDIGKNLPENSQITYRVWEKDNHNHVLYPSTSGIFTMEKAITFCRCFYNSITPNKQWQMAFDYRDEFYIEPTWELLAKNNKLSMPSNNKIIINLKNQGDSWTAPCDGYIWGMKIGGSDVVNSWLNVWDSTDADTSNYGTLIYCDYGQPYINLCGNLAVRKGQTVYFNWSNDCRVYFYPALNANSSVYGEDVRIYIQVVNSQGIVRGATVNISIGSEYTETGKTLTDGRYLLSYAGYNVLKTAESLNVEVTCEDGTTGQTQVPVGYFEDKINELQVLVS